jgi:hypothetical protein
VSALEIVELKYRTKSGIGRISKPWQGVIADFFDKTICWPKKENLL